MFGSSYTDSPSGYITMTASDILAGVTAYFDERAAQQKAWDDALPGILLEWRQGLNWLGRFWYSDWPKDGPGLVEMWHKTDSTLGAYLPEVPKLKARPHTAGWMHDWRDNAKRLAPDTKVFINASHGSTITAWIPKPKP